MLIIWWVSEWAGFNKYLVKISIVVSSDMNDHVDNKMQTYSQCQTIGCPAYMYDRLS